MEDIYMNAYQRAKEKARNMAVEWQNDFCDQNYSWGDLVYWQGYFERLGRKYGLIKEFRENGII